MHRPAIFRVPCFVLEMAMGDASELLCKGQHVVPKRLSEAGFRFEFNDIDSAFADIIQ
ncbi:DUF1731 domain-containing protein [Kaarinaea lacus]